MVNLSTEKIRTQTKDTNHADLTTDEENDAQVSTENLSHGHM